MPTSRHQLKRTATSAFSSAPVKYERKRQLATSNASVPAFDGNASPSGSEFSDSDENEDLPRVSVVISRSPLQSSPTASPRSLRRKKAPSVEPSFDLLSETGHPDSAGLRPRPVEATRKLTVIFPGEPLNFTDDSGTVRQLPPSIVEGAHSSPPSPIDVPTSTITIQANRRKPTKAKRISSNGDFRLPSTYLKASDLHPTAHADYDIDSEDEEWLLKYNRDRTNPLDKGDYERMIDVVEHEAFKAARARRLLPTCSICCGPGVSGGGPALSTCATCGVRVHSECYGIVDDSEDKITELSWTCSSCSLADSPPCCVLCGKSGGALKPSEGGGFCHILCALCVPGCSFRNSRTRSPVLGVSNILKRRRKDQADCEVCLTSDGVTVPCSNSGCKSCLHASCAQTKNQVQPGASRGQLKILCSQHMPSTPPLVTQSRALTLLEEFGEHALPVFQHWMTRRTATPEPLLNPLQMSDIPQAWVLPDGAKMSRRSALAEINKLKDLRWDLERARMLCDLVRRRERLRKVQIDVEARMLEVVVENLGKKVPVKGKSAIRKAREANLKILSDAVSSRDIAR